MDEAIEVRNLSKNYGKVRAIRGISFKVDKGEIFGLIGPNGAGKTTALRIISTLLQVTSGSVKIFGYDLTKQPDKVRECISYLPEEAGAYKNLTGKDYLEFMAGFYAGNSREKKDILRKGIEIAQLAE